MVDQAPGARYHAFLSYSHQDAAAAGKLHRRLEAYRLPKRLVGQETPRGPVPERLVPIFRDRDELPAASDLSETVRVALGESAALVVLCSPAAESSFWVAEEIRTFRSLHPDRPILAAVVRGEPADCFPATLRDSANGGGRVEPLATDLRPEGDGPTLGLLKLVAGITGVGLDALVQRDAARRVRRVTAVTAVAVVAMLIMAALTFMALEARREAEQQRGEVARQIEFLLTDLRTRLKDVGRLDIQLAVNRHALDYYSRQKLEGLGPKAVELRARGLLAVGEDFLSLGDLERASAAFREAHRTTAEQLRRSPDDAGRIFAHAQSEYWIGRVHELRRQWPEALGQYRRYAAAAARLIAIAPDNPDYMMEMGYASINIGTVELDGLSDNGRARSSFETGLRWFERAERARPGDEEALRKQANTHGWLADMFYADKLLRQSLGERQRQHDILRRLHLIKPSHKERLYELALAQRAVARLSWLVGDRKRAAVYYREAYENALLLRRHDPRNADWLVLKAMIECELVFAPPALRRSWSRDALRREMAAALVQIEAQRHPSAADISRCLVNS